MTNLLTVNYKQTGKSANLNDMGMREMQARAYEARHEQYLLLKAPPASGKSRALMFLALSKLHEQGLKKVIVAVPEMSIGGSFKDTQLTANGFFADSGNLGTIHFNPNIISHRFEFNESLASFQQGGEDGKARLHVCLTPLLVLGGVEFETENTSADHTQPINVHDIQRLLVFRPKDAQQVQVGTQVDSHTFGTAFFHGRG